MTREAKEHQCDALCWYDPLTQQVMHPWTDKDIEGLDKFLEELLSRDKHPGQVFMRCHDGWVDEVYAQHCPVCR